MDHDTKPSACRRAMHVVGLVTQKGGSGKSTTGASLAVAAMQRGIRVFMLELDRQGTWSAWTEARETEDLDFEAIDANDLAPSLETLRRANYDLVIIDTPGTDNPAINEVMRLCDLALIPCRPTVLDLQGCVPTVAALSRMRKSFAFVLTQCPPHSARVEQYRAHLARLGVIAEPPIVSRVDHQDAFAHGMGVTEFNREGAAAGEIRALWNWIETKLEMKSDAET